MTILELLIFVPLCAVGLIISGGWSLLWLCCVTGIVPRELQEEVPDENA